MREISRLVYPLTPACGRQATLSHDGERDRLAIIKERHDLSLEKSPGKYTQRQKFFVDAMACTITIVFTKLGVSKYMSHLDLLRLFGRAARRARLPFAVSEGFSKHPKIVITRALKLGLESENEEAKFILNKEMAAEEFKQRIQKQLPEGILIQAKGPGLES